MRHISGPGFLDELKGDPLRPNYFGKGDFAVRYKIESKAFAVVSEYVPQPNAFIQHEIDDTNNNNDKTPIILDQDSIPNPKPKPVKTVEKKVLKDKHKKYSAINVMIHTEGEKDNDSNLDESNLKDSDKKNDFLLGTPILLGKPKINATEVIKRKKDEQQKHIGFYQLIMHTYNSNILYEGANQYYFEKFYKENLGVNYQFNENHTKDLEQRVTTEKKNWDEKGNIKTGFQNYAVAMFNSLVENKVDPLELLNDMLKDLDNPKLQKKYLTSLQQFNKNQDRKKVIAQSKLNTGLAEHNKKNAAKVKTVKLVTDFFNFYNPLLGVVVENLAPSIISQKEFKEKTDNSAKMITKMVDHFTEHQKKQSEFFEGCAREQLKINRNKAKNSEDIKQNDDREVVKGMIKEQLKYNFNANFENYLRYLLEKGSRDLTSTNNLLNHFFVDDENLKENSIDQFLTDNVVKIIAPHIDDLNLFKGNKQLLKRIGDKANDIVNKKDIMDFVDKVLEAKTVKEEFAVIEQLRFKLSVMSIKDKTKFDADMGENYLHKIINKYFALDQGTSNTHDVWQSNHEFIHKKAKLETVLKTFLESLPLEERVKMFDVKSKLDGLTPMGLIYDKHGVNKAKFMYETDNYAPEVLRLFAIMQPYQVEVNQRFLQNNAEYKSSYTSNTLVTAIAFIITFFKQSLKTSAQAIALIQGLSETAKNAKANYGISKQKSEDAGVQGNKALHKMSFNDQILIGMYSKNFWGKMFLGNDLKSIIIKEDLGDDNKVITTPSHLLERLKDDEFDFNKIREVYKLLIMRHSLLERRINKLSYSGFTSYTPWAAVFSWWYDYERTSLYHLKGDVTKAIIKIADLKKNDTSFETKVNNSSFNKLNHIYGKDFEKFNNCIKAMLYSKGVINEDKVTSLVSELVNNTQSKENFQKFSTLITEHLIAVNIEEYSKIKQILNDIQNPDSAKLEEINKDVKKEVIGALAKLNDFIESKEFLKGADIIKEQVNRGKAQNQDEASIAERLKEVKESGLNFDQFHYSLKELYQQSDLDRRADIKGLNNTWGNTFTSAIFKASSFLGRDWKPSSIDNTLNSTTACANAGIRALCEGGYVFVINCPQLAIKLVASCFTGGVSI